MMAIKFPKFLDRPGRRSFFASLLLLLGIALPERRSTRMVERDGWFLDASDR